MQTKKTNEVSQKNQAFEKKRKITLTPHQKKCKRSKKYGLIPTKSYNFQ